MVSMGQDNQTNPYSILGAVGGWWLVTRVSRVPTPDFESISRLVRCVSWTQGVCRYWISPRALPAMASNPLLGAHASAAQSAVFSTVRTLLPSNTRTISTGLASEPTAIYLASGLQATAPTASLRSEVVTEAESAHALADKA